MNDKDLTKKSTISKKKGTTTKKVKVVGTEQFTNNQTGEVENFQVIKIEERDFNFDKIWLFHILESMDLIGGQKMKVMTTLLQLKNRDNLIITTQKDLSKLTNVSRPIISQTIKLLCESNFLKKKQPGVYFINPEMLFNGGKTNRMNILFEYNRIGEPEEKETKISDEPETHILTKPKEK